MYMGTAWGSNRLLYRALAISLALHLVFALFFPALATVQGDGPSVETISFVRVLHISVLPARPVARTHPAVAIERAPVPAVVIPPRNAGPASHEKRTLPARSSRAPMVGEEQRRGGTVAQAETSAPPAAVTATPAAATVASSETRENTGGYMPLGAEEADPVLDPEIQRSLQALGAHTTLTIVVDAAGKTNSVSFSPDVDGAIESQIRSMLAEAHWDPAICGAGVSCEGRTTIRL